MADPLDPAPAHADAFARAFPAIADRLAQIGLDPDLERLVEGFTELAKRVERVIDATSLRSVGHFAELSRRLLRPFPSATIMELSALGARRARARTSPPAPSSRASRSTVRSAAFARMRRSASSPGGYPTQRPPGPEASGTRSTSASAPSARTARGRARSRSGFTSSASSAPRS